MVQRIRITDLCPTTIAGTLALSAALLLCHSAANCQDRERPKTDREVAQRHLEVMRLALPALREAEKGDAVELLQRAIRAREVVLEGRRDDEAAKIRERSPNRGDQAEILGLAAQIWKEFGRTERARAVEQLAEQLASTDRPQRERPARERDERRDRIDSKAMERIHRLEDRVAELAEAIEALERHVLEIKEHVE